LGTRVLRDIRYARKSKEGKTGELLEIASRRHEFLDNPDIDYGRIYLIVHLLQGIFIGA
jgi:hypothetical protein